MRRIYTRRTNVSKTMRVTNFPNLFLRSLLISSLHILHSLLRQVVSHALELEWDLGAELAIDAADALQEAVQHRVQHRPLVSQALRD